MKILGSTTVVTGGASGLGRATAERLLAGGGRVTLLDLPRSPGTQVAADMGDNALFAPADVTNPDEVTAALDAEVGPEATETPTPEPPEPSELDGAVSADAPWEDTAAWEEVLE